MMLSKALHALFEFHSPGNAYSKPIALQNYEEAIRRVAILAMLYLLPAFWILRPVIIDPDIWWHLQTGKWIVEHGSLPATDHFSAYGEGKPWVAYSWLFEVGMYELVSVCGESGIILYTLVGVWLIMLALHRIVASRIFNFALVCGLLAMSTVVLSRLFTPRPWLLTILFFAITLQVVLSLREGKRSGWFWALPAVYVVWANVHIQFIYGLSLLGLACIAPLVDRYLPPVLQSCPLMVCGSPQWRKLIGLTALCALATLATPHNVGLYRLAFELSAQTGMWEYAYEMQAPEFRTTADWMMLLLFALTLIQLGRRAHWSSFDVLLVLVAGISAFRGFRDSWFLVLASIAVAASQRHSLDEGQRSFRPLVWFLPVCFIVAVGTVVIWGYREFSETKILQNTAKLYPIEAAAFVEQQGYRGPLYNHFDWGGYLIWRLPHLKVSMDGRANVHGDQRIKRALATWAGGPHWTEDQDLNRGEVVIAHKKIALTAILRLDPRFRVVYQDDTAVVFVRASPSKGAEPANLPAPGKYPPSSTALAVASAQ